MTLCPPHAVALHQKVVRHAKCLLQWPTPCTPHQWPQVLSHLYRHTPATGSCEQQSPPLLLTHTMQQYVVLAREPLATGTKKPPGSPQVMHRAAYRYAQKHLPNPHRYSINVCGTTPPTTRQVPMPLRAQIDASIVPPWLTTPLATQCKTALQ